MIREPLTVPTPCCTKPLSKDIMLATKKNWLKEAAPTNTNFPKDFQGSPKNWFKMFSEGFPGKPKT